MLVRAIFLIKTDFFNITSKDELKKEGNFKISDRETQKLSRKIFVLIRPIFTLETVNFFLNHRQIKTENDSMAMEDRQNGG